MRKTSINIFNQVVKYIIRYFKWIVLFSALLLLLSGVYKVNSNEVAVVLRFGKLVGSSSSQQIKKPGLHFTLPYFIDKVIRIPVETVQEKTVTTQYGDGDNMYSDIPNSGYLITGDNNIVRVKAKVKYTISDPVSYSLYKTNIEQLIDGVVSGELTQKIVGMKIDSVLTDGKQELTDRTVYNTQQILDELKTGVKLASIELTDIVPPSETKQYFEEVINASVNKQTAIQKAQETASTIITKAEGDASDLKQTALTDQSEKVTKANQDVSEFNGIYEQYAANSEVIKNGAFRQRVTTLLSKMGGSVIVPEGTSTPRIILP